MPHVEFMFSPEWQQLMQTDQPAAWRHQRELVAQHDQSFASFFPAPPVPTISGISTISGGAIIIGVNPNDPISVAQGDILRQQANWTNRLREEATKETLRKEQPSPTLALPSLGWGLGAGLAGFGAVIALVIVAALLLRR